MGASGTQCSTSVPVGAGGGGPLGSGKPVVNGGGVPVGGAPGGTAGNPGDAGNAATVVTAVPTVHRRSANDNRRSNKPIMEKRRRARINNCLNELKALILDATKKDPARHSKLEKADILEMTVRHLETLRRQRAALSAAADPSVLNKYKAGFSECAAEVSRFLMRHADNSSSSSDNASSSSSSEQHFKRRLLSHLTHCLNGVSSTDERSQVPPNVAHPLQDTMDDPSRHSLPAIAPKRSSTPSEGGSDNSSRTTALFSAAGLQLVPTRLPNGDIALVLPSQHSERAQQQPPQSTTPSSCSSPSQPASPGSPPPLVMAFPSRTASTTSCSSSASSSSSVSPVVFDRPTSFALTVPRPSPARVRAVKPVAVVAGSPAVCAVAPGTTESPAIFGCTRPLSPPLQKPLSLVMRKGVVEESMEEDGPWRPW